MDNLKQALEAAFAEATKVYRERGFQRRVGFGSKPALINVDLANAWTRPGNPFTCENIDDQIIPAVQRLSGAFRKYGFPVVFTTTCYQVTDRTNPNTDMGLVARKNSGGGLRRKQQESRCNRFAHRSAPRRANHHKETGERISRHVSRGFSTRGKCRHHFGDRRHGIGLRARRPFVTAWRKVSGRLR